MKKGRRPLPAATKRLRGVIMKNRISIFFILNLFVLCQSPNFVLAMESGRFCLTDLPPECLERIFLYTLGDRLEPICNNLNSEDKRRLKKELFDKIMLEPSRELLRLKYVCKEFSSVIEGWLLYWNISWFDGDYLVD